MAAVADGWSASGANHFSASSQHPLLLHVGRDRQNGVRRAVVGAVEGLDVRERGSGDMVGRQADGRPAVGVDLVGERPQQHRLVAVGLVEVIAGGTPRSPPSSRLRRLAGVMSSPSMRSASEPEGRFEVVLRERDVEIRVVVVGEGVVVARKPSAPEGRNSRTVARSAEHQVFEQVGESRACGVFVARADPVEDIHGGEFQTARSRLTTTVSPLGSVFLVYGIIVAQRYEKVRWLQTGIAWDGPVEPSGR